MPWRGRDARLSHLDGWLVSIDLPLRTCGLMQSVVHAKPLCDALPLASQSRVRTPLKTAGTASDAPVQGRVGRPKRGVAGGVGHVRQRRSPQSDVGCIERTTRVPRIHFYSELHRSPQMFHAHRVNGSREVLTR